MSGLGGELLGKETTRAHEKKIGHRDCSPWRLTVSSPWAHGELTVTKMVTDSRDWAVTWAVIELWPSRDHTEDAVIELWPRRDWAVTSPWLSCDLAVTELWPRRDWAVTSPSRDWAVIIGPGAVTTVVTVSSPWAHGDIFFLMGDLVGYVLAGDWWVSYLWQGKVHLQLLFMMGLLDMKMINWIV